MESALEKHPHRITRLGLDARRRLEREARRLLDLGDVLADAPRVGTFAIAPATARTQQSATQQRGTLHPPFLQAAHVTSRPVATATTRAISMPRTTIPSSMSTFDSSVSTVPSVEGAGSASLTGAGLGGGDAPFDSLAGAEGRAGGGPMKMASRSAPNCSSADATLLSIGSSIMTGSRSAGRAPVRNCRRSSRRRRIRLSAFGEYCAMACV